MIEGEGGGIREVFDSAARAGLPRPRLTNSGVQFTAFLWLPPRGRDSESATPPSRPAPDDAVRQKAQSVLQKREGRQTRNEDAVVAALAATKASTIHELIDRSKLTAGQVRYALAPLLEEGLVTMNGRRGDKNTTYGLAGAQ